MFLTNAFFNDNIFKFIDDEFFFNSSVRDMSPTVYYKKENDYIIEVKTLGIDKENINVKLEDNILSVSGENKNEYNDKSFNVNIKVRLGKDLISNIESIDYTSKNGITYVFIKMKKSKTSTIKINKI